jgi:hypothetical protein
MQVKLSSHLLPSLSSQMPRSKFLLSVLSFIGSSWTQQSNSAGKMSNEQSDASTIRILFNGGDNMLGRAVQLSFPHQSPGEELIRDSCTASHYLDMCIQHPSGHGKPELSLSEIRELNKEGRYLWGDYKVRFNFFQALMKQNSVLIIRIAIHQLHGLCRN